MTHITYNRAASDRESRRIMIERAADAAIAANELQYQAAAIIGPTLLSVVIGSAIVAWVLL
jgi:hypothetical protein